MALEPYVVPTTVGMQKLSRTHRLSMILKGVFDIFNENDDIDISGEGVYLQVHLVDNKIVVELAGEGQ